MKIDKNIALYFLRASISFTFIWFGMLKLLNISPVLKIIEKAMPLFILNLPGFYTILALAEITIGVGILFNKTKKIAAIVLIGHLCIASISVYVTQGFSHNVFILTLPGEFVVKNLVLIACGLVVLAD
jgi:uncharacterized membrane protein YkgB